MEKNQNIQISEVPRRAVSFSLDKVLVFTLVVRIYGMSTFTVLSFPKHTFRFISLCLCKSGTKGNIKD